jgi:hypothetical protein
MLSRHRNKILVLETANTMQKIHSRASTVAAALQQHSLQLQRVYCCVAAVLHTFRACALLPGLLPKHSAARVANLLPLLLLLLLLLLLHWTVESAAPLCHTSTPVWHPASAVTSQACLHPVAAALSLALLLPALLLPAVLLMCCFCLCCSASRVRLTACTHPLWAPARGPLLCA